MKMRRIRSHELQRLHEAALPPLGPPPRLRDSWPIMLVAFFAIFFGVLIIIWNEAKAVAAARALDESYESIIAIDAKKEISNELVGKLVYLRGEIVVHEPVTDPEYGISIPAVKLKRRVQMYQWIEEEAEHFENGEKTTTQFFYFTDWRDKIINSALFANSIAHRNPRDFPVKTQVVINDKITLGKYELSEELKEKFNIFEEIAGDERPENKDVKLHAGLYYHAQDIWNPEVGDLRIQFSYAGLDGEEISVIGKIDSRDRIVPFKTNLGVNILLMSLGEVTPEEMFSEEHCANQFLTWCYRLAAWFILYIGSSCMSKIFRILCQQSGAFPEAVPTLSMTMSVSIYLVVTGFAWLWYKPSLGFVLLIFIVAIVYFTAYLCERHSQATRAAYAARFAQAAEAARLSRILRASRNFGTHNNFTRYNRYNRL